MATQTDRARKPLDLWKIWPARWQVQCEAPSKVSPYMKRADTDLLKEIFIKYASVEAEDGEHYMTYDDFVHKYLGIMPKDGNPETATLLAACVDTNKNGRISFVEFQAFEALLCQPDALYALAFQIFDTNSSGFVTFDEFENLIKHTTLNDSYPFNFDSDFIRLHFGNDRERNVTYAEFTQLLHDFHDEHALQAFLRKDIDNTGFISTLDFYDIMVHLKSHLVTDFVRENTVRVAGGGKGGHQVSYPYFISFISLLNNMELVKKIFMSASKGTLSKEITKEEFMAESQQFTQITPMEIDILYQLVDMRQSTGRMSYDDILAMAPVKDHRHAYRLQIMQDKVHDSYAGVGRGALLQILENVYRFALGSIAGAVGAATVYPIDLVKTRLQNQRLGGSVVGELMYKNSFDCAKKVIRHEGILGLYRGLAPQLVGVAPEKAIKLTMNDLVRDKITSKDGSIPLWGEMIAGGTAGASQVMFTNPLEIVKIRLQVAGEVATTKRISALTVIRELGFFGLYKGARACFARDIPFSAIYFTMYAHTKKLLANENGYNNPLSLLTAATISGAPAASLTTPFDVIKTRLQVVAREGQTTYNGMFDCARKIYKEEGGRAFWKGAPARVVRSSPQFGVTLMVYELLQRVFYVDFGGRKLEGAQSVEEMIEEKLPANPDHIGGYRLALACFEGMESKFGLCLPKYKRLSPPSSLTQPQAQAS